MTHFDRSHRGAAARVISAVTVGLAVAACSSPVGGGASSSALPSDPAPTAGGPSPIALASVPEEPALETVWEKGGPETSQPRTWSPAVDPEGRVWVASSFDDTFWIFDRDGEYLESWGDPGAGEGQFNFARDGGDSFGAIAFAPDGGFYVGDTGNHRVQRFDADRNFVSAWGTFGTEDGQFASLNVISVGPDGKVYVLDDARGVLQVFDADGQFLRAQTGIWPQSLATDGDGNGYFVTGQPPELRKVNPDGETLMSVSLASIPTAWAGIAVRSDGDIFIASETGSTAAEDPGVLLQIDADGTLLHRWPNGGNGIAIDPSGDRIYVSFFLWDYIRAYALPQD